MNTLVDLSQHVQIFGFFLFYDFFGGLCREVYVTSTKVISDKARQ